jgi:riboflavin-specific deaminase-like protein
VDQILPEPQGFTFPYDAARPQRPEEPLLRVNFVASLDGGVTDEWGRSGGLSGPGDREMFFALRAWADAIMIGAGTLRAEGYGPHRPSPELEARRAADGRPRPAAMVIVTRSLDIDLDTPLFTQARTPTIVLTCGAAPEERRRLVAKTAKVIVAGGQEVDLADGVGALRAEGLGSILCEGGPKLAGGLFAAGLVDELCLTLAPALLGQEGPRLVEGLDRRVGFELVAAACEGSELYLRYGAVY